MTLSIAELFDHVCADLAEPSASALLVGLIEACNDAQMMSDKDQQIYIGIIRYLLGVADFNMRERAASAALETQGLPGDIYLYFACDTISIAADFLAPSVALSESDLNHIAQNCSREHRLALLAREDLTAAVRREILNQDEADVIRAMNENDAQALFFEYDDRLEALNSDASLLQGDEQENGDSGVDNPLDIILKSHIASSRFADIIDAIAKYAQIPKPMVKSLFSHKDAEPISILCRGLGVSEETFTEFATFRCRRLGQMGRMAETAVVAYREIDPAYAKEMLSDLQAQTPQLARKLSSA